MNKSIYHSLTKPIIGLAPVDGVTDTAFREMVDTYSKPSLMFTEFVPAEGFAHGAIKLLHAFHTHKTKTPVIGQLFGIDPESFYQSVFIIAEMGLHGVDINMGCPARNIVQKGGGAGLILNPMLAQQIVKTVQQACLDWSGGKKIEDVGLPIELVNEIKNYRIKNKLKINRVLLPVSVKTRIGFETIVTKEWISSLLETGLDLITLHGRILRQMYTGKANWDEIQLAAETAKGTKTMLFGNGDIESMHQAKQYIKTYKVNGVLVGRATFGNPWFFSDYVPTVKERMHAMIQQAELFLKYRPTLGIAPLRKHFCWYCIGFPRYQEMRNSLMHAMTLDEVKKIISHT